MDHKKINPVPKDGEYIIVTQKVNGRYEFDKYGEYFIANDASLAFETQLHYDSLLQDLVEDYIPFFFERGLAKIPTQFEEVKTEIKLWLENKYKIQPNSKGFIPWYFRRKLWPYTKENVAIVFLAQWASAENTLYVIKGRACFMTKDFPKITDEDLQEYSFYKQQQLEENDKKLRMTIESPLQQKRRKPELGTLVWLFPSSELDDLYSEAKGKYIECSLEEFRGIFGIGNFIGPVVWKTNNASELVYFNIRLQEIGGIEHQNRQSWMLIKKLFIKTTGEHFTENFKNLKTTINRDLSESTRSAIDELIESIL